jgi:hypothetical protein
MKFLRSDLPVWLGFVGGVVVLAAVSFSAKPLQDYSKAFLEFTVVLAAFAMALGFANVFRIYANRVRFRRGKWQLSYVTLTCMVLYLLIGLIGGTKGVGYTFVFNNVFAPLEATVFSLNAFHMCTACYRAFRIRNGLSAALLIAGTIVMLGSIGIGTAIWKGFATWTGWLMNVPTSAGIRAVNIGAALGAIGVGFRMILGLERGHLGGAE